MKRLRPEGKEWEAFVDAWYLADHDGKLNLSTYYGVSYDTSKHWVSDTGATRKQVEDEPSFQTKMTHTNLPLRLNTGSDMTTFAVLGDTHNPYQDNETLANVEQFLEEIQPNYLVYNGDLNDFYQVSVFDKDPSRLGSLQSDLDVTTRMFERHSNMLPNTKKLFVEGTHEHRWFKYLRLHAPALANLDGTSVTELYKLKEFDITYVPFEQGVLINGVFLLLHGDIISSHSSYTAKRHYEKHGGSGMCNHTHRGGSFYKRDRFGIWGWWENFCLCNLNPDWIQNPDWQQGFSLIHFTVHKRFWVESIPIINHKFLYGGKVYGN